MCQVWRRTEGEELREFWAKRRKETEGVDYLDVDSKIILKWILSRTGPCGMD
jgi:hypothetical protein